MAIKTQTFHIAVCDACGAEFDETGDFRGWDDTPELALAQVQDMPDSHWTVLADNRVVCPISDTSHYLARGGESPALLEAGPDAMVARFGGAIETRYRAA
jgi:hypothetical protein